MDRLLNELTLYSKIDTNRIPYNFKKINVSDYFNDCIEEIGLDLETRGIGLTYFNYADEDIVIIARFSFSAAIFSSVDSFSRLRISSKFRHRSPISSGSS